MGVWNPLRASAKNNYGGFWLPGGYGVACVTCLQTLQRDRRQRTTSDRNEQDPCKDVENPRALPPPGPGEYGGCGYQ
jgi:hypothetical protein